RRSRGPRTRTGPLSRRGRRPPTADGGARGQGRTAVPPGPEGGAAGPLAVDARSMKPWGQPDFGGPETVGPARGSATGTPSGARPRPGGTGVPRTARGDGDRPGGATGRAGRP